MVAKTVVFVYVHVMYVAWIQLLFKYPECLPEGKGHLKQQAMSCTMVPSLTL